MPIPAFQKIAGFAAAVSRTDRYRYAAAVQRIVEDSVDPTKRRYTEST